MRPTRSWLGITAIGWLLCLSCVPSGYFQLGMYANRERRFDDAIHYYTLHLQQNPGDAEAYRNRALAYLYKGLFDSTLADCGRALALRPNLGEAFHLTGLVSFFRRDYETAIGYFNQATELEPRLHDTYLTRGRCYMALNRCELALSDFNKALVLRPQDAVVLNLRAEVLERLGRFPEAARDRDGASKLRRRK